LVKALQGGDMNLEKLDDAQLALLGDAVRFERRRRSRPGPPRVPRRALAIDALELLAIPSTPRLVSWVVNARTDEMLDPRILTTIRHDDQGAWTRDVESGRVPGPKLAPALDEAMLEPVRALLTLSTWPLAQRMVTPHSPRSDHPFAILRLLDEADRLDDVDSDAARRLTALAARLTMGLPGAGSLSTQGAAASRADLRRVAQGELTRFLESASQERAAAAERASRLPEINHIWGSPGLMRVEPRRLAKEG
jgi:hypothetical protein